VPSDARKRLTEGTRHWIMRDFREGASDRRATQDGLGKLVEQTLDRFDRNNIESWDDDDWQAVCLQLLWQLSVDGVGRAGRTSKSPQRHLRHRDALLSATGIDADELTHDVLIRFASAFLDQGYAHWPLPD